jgi:tetratricopeptide (TPR) repeat protein
VLERALEPTSGERSVTRVALLSRLCGALYYSDMRDRMSALADEATALADELGDPQAKALAAAARRRAYWHPSQLDQRLSDATELLTRGREAGDLELALQGHAWLVVDLLEQGNPEAVDAQIDAFLEGADLLRQPLFLWQAAVWRAMRALLAGELERADRLAAEALEAGSKGEAVTAPQYYAIQLLALRREQGRISELEAPAREMIRRSAAIAAWPAALATLLWETGRIDEARALFEDVAKHEFDDIPRDGDWLIAITLLADTAAELHDARRSEKLYELLLPYREANVVIGLAAVCLGSAARFLGRLAGAMGRAEEAAEHFERALEGNAKLHAPVFLAHTQLDYARLLGPKDPRARALIAEAARAAEELALPAVARRAAELG